MTKTQIIKANADMITKYCLKDDEDELIEDLLNLVDDILTKQLYEELVILLESNKKE